MCVYIHISISISISIYISLSLYIYIYICTLMPVKAHGDAVCGARNDSPSYDLMFPIF